MLGQFFGSEWSCGVVGGSGPPTQNPMKIGFSQLVTTGCDSEQPRRVRLIIAWSQVQILSGPPSSAKRWEACSRVWKDFEAYNGAPVTCVEPQKRQSPDSEPSAQTQRVVKGKPVFADS